MQPISLLGLIVTFGLMATACKTPGDAEQASAEVQAADSPAMAAPKLIHQSMTISSGVFGNSVVRYGVQAPATSPAKGDVVFLPGFADNIDYHVGLFKTFNDQGLRVITFDYPSHGGSSGVGINHYDFRDLAAIAVAVEARTREPGAAGRPLILAGWSTGGLLAVRMVQSQNFPAFSGRRLAGMILLAPGISVYKAPWEFGDGGFVTLETLTRSKNIPNVPADARIRPNSPLFKTPVFATWLVENSLLAQSQSYPEGLWTLVVVAGTEADVYANTPAVIKWVRSRRTSTKVKLVGVHCEGARHWLDVEPSPVGNQVLEVVGRAAGQMALPATTGLLPGWNPKAPCSPF